MLVLLITASYLPGPPITGHWPGVLPEIVWTIVADLAALAAVQGLPAAAVVDTALGWAQPGQILDALRARFPLCPVVLIADADAQGLAAWDVAAIADIVRRDDGVRLPLAVVGAVERARLAAEVRQLRRSAAQPPQAPHPLNDELYQMFVFQSNDGIWCFALDPPLPVAAPVDVQVAHAYRHAVLVECNDAMARMYGYASAAELIGTRLDELLDPADPRNTAYLEAFFRSGYRLTGAESFEQDRDGRELVFRNSLIGTVVGEHVVRAWGIQQDITAQVREERAQRLRAAAGALLAEALDYDATLSNVARLLVPDFADYGLVHTLEPAMALRQRVAVHRDPAMQPLLDRLGALIAGRIGHPASVVSRVLHTGEPAMQPEVSPEQARAVVGEGELLELYERLGPRSYIVAPLRARGQVRGTLSLVRGERQPFDEADLALAEELAGRCAIALDNALLYAEAQEALRARDEMLMVASHELRTPLTAVMGFAALLQRRAARDQLLSERDQRVLATIAQQSTRMERLISLVLDEARLSAGRLELAHTPVDLGAMAERVVAQIEPGLEHHRIAVEVPTTPLIIHGDGLRLEQVLEHLLLNAVKYSPAGGIILVAVAQDGEGARLEVCDQGIGIPIADLPRVGERFFRAGNAAPRQLSGTGIGLYVIRGIVAAHGGTLEIASVEGQGTTVTVRLPLAS